MNDDIHVRKDVFDVFIARVDALIDESKAYTAAAEARTAALIEENNARLDVYRADSRRESESLAADIKAIRDSINDMKSHSAFWQGLLGLVIGLSAIAVAAVQVYIAVR